MNKNVFMYVCMYVSKYYYPIMSSPSKPKPKPKANTNTTTAVVPTKVVVDKGNNNRRRALLLACNYPGTKYELKGCKNDAENLKDFLIAQNIIAEANITLVEEPTGEKIIQLLHGLAVESQKGCLDYLFLSWSGHGSQVLDQNKDLLMDREDDGADECILPADFEKRGVLIDDDMRGLLHAFSPKTKVFFVCDSCHSGSFLDLEYHYLSRTLCHEEHRCEADFPRTMMISGCKDEQTSADVFDAKRNEMAGGCTSAFLDAMKKDINGCSKNVFTLLASIRKHLAQKQLTQTPQLTTSFKIVMVKPEDLTIF